MQNTSMHPKKAAFRPRLLSVLLAATGGATLMLAQSAPAPTAPATKKADPALTKAAVESASPAERKPEDVYQLSPFTVTSDDDDGYQALTTLGGTRLRSDLRDLAASISVVTKQMMEDISADSWDRLAPFTLGTEVGGLSGNFSDSFLNGTFQDFDSTRRNLTPNVRLRGLAAATRTRDYFLTDVPGDNYNVERVEIQRGPNGMLYGLGSPSGVINEGLLRANMQRDKTTITTRVDSNSGYRGTLDYNHVLKKDKLALRIASVYKNERYMVEEAYSRERRFFGTATYKPFKDTTVRVSGETATVFANPPRNAPPFDGYSYWWDAGKPIYDGFTGQYTVLGTLPTGSGFTGNPNQFAVNFAHRAGSPYFIVENPTTGVFGLSIPGNPIAAEEAATRLFRNATNTGWRNGDMVGMNPWREFERVRARAAKGGVDSDFGFWRVQQMSDSSVFDFFNHQLDGPSRHRDGRWKTYNFTVEQRLGQHAGLEVAYDHQSLDERFRDTVQFDRYKLTLDVTTVLPIGAPNPNFGRLFFTDSFFDGATNRLRDAFRATAYYDLDFNRVLREGSLLARILGRHTLTSNFTDQDQKTKDMRGSEMYDMSYYNMVQSQNVGTTAVARVTSNGQRGLGTTVYTGPNITTFSGPTGFSVDPLGVSLMPQDRGFTSVPILYHQTPPLASTTPIGWTTSTFNVINIGEWDVNQVANQGSLRYSRFTALSAVLQDRWLDDHLISTFGWRRDHVKTYDAGALTFDTTGQPILQNWKLRKQIDQSHNAFNYGLVLHTPDFITKHLPTRPQISFAYNKSDNFTPQAQRLNVYGANIDPTKGTTDEYGVTLSLFNRKLELRASSYKTVSALATNSGVSNTILDFDRQMFRTMAGIEAGTFSTQTIPVAPEIQAAFVQFLRNPAFARFANTNVTGWFVDANGHLQGAEGGTIGRVVDTSDTLAKGIELEVTANLTRNWRLTANANRQQSVLSNSATAFWDAIESWRPLLVGTLAGQQPWNPGGTEPWETRFLSNEATVRRVRDQDGTISPEVRRWRYNLISNYSFSTGRLKGWGIGGAVRWQDKVAIGYATKFDQNNVAVSDVSKPYFGPTETNFDAWLSYNHKIWHNKINWKAQLNIRDIGQHHRLIPVSAQPTGAIAAWRIANDTSWALSNTFEF